jgi:hypothetical protein
MAREVNRLTARKVQTLLAPGRHADGGGLYLTISDAGAKSWIFLYRHAGRRREMGLGGVLAVPLAREREGGRGPRGSMVGKTPSRRSAPPRRATSLRRAPLPSPTSPKSSWPIVKAPGATPRTGRSGGKR